MKKLSRRTRSREPIRRPWSRKVTQTGEEAVTKVPKTGTSQGQCQNQGGGGVPLVSIVGKRGISKRIADTSGMTKGETTVLNQK